MPPQSPERLVSAYHSRLLTLRTAASNRVAALWASLGAVGDSRFPEVAAATVTATQARVVALTSAYLASYAAHLTGTKATPTGISLDDLNLRNGADPLEVYQRPIITARTALADGKPYAEAMSIARTRALSTVETDVMLAQQATIAPATAGGPITRYRRVLTGRSCALCAGISDRTYGRADLMPIHSRCDCAVAPVVSGLDPGKALNGPHLAALSDLTPAEAQARHLHVDDTGPVLPAVAIRHHRELGPLVTLASHDFASWGDL